MSKYERPFVVAAVLAVSAICDGWAAAGWAAADLAQAARLPNRAQDAAIVKTVPDFHVQELQSDRGWRELQSDGGRQESQSDRGRQELPSDRGRWIPGLHVFSLSDGLAVDPPAAAADREVWRPASPVRARF